MSADLFLTALHGTVLPHEGRRSCDPDDPGGATDYGISLRFLKGEGIDIDGDGDVDADDVWALEGKPEEVERLYRRYFWEPMHAGHFESPPVAVKLFDTAVNVGPMRAIKIAQAATGQDVDGLLGPQTFRALNDADPERALEALCRAQLRFYRAIVERRAVAAKFLPGWTVRAGCTILTPCRVCRAHKR